MYGDIDFYDIQDHIFGVSICIISFLSTLLSWQITAKKHNNKVIKISITFVFSIFIFSIFTTVFYFLYRNLLYNLSSSFDHLLGNFVYGLTMSHLYISGLTISYLYFLNSKNMELNIKKLELEKEMFKLKILQKKLEPHFLFNNLSILSSLVKNYPIEVESFIDDFSDVYRYYLKHSNQDVVSIYEELFFINAYTKLIARRFTNTYFININIENEIGFILPCTIQLCIENAIKHNFASEENPLSIFIDRVDDYIIIKNNLRKIESSSSSKFGNEYLAKQYSELFNKKIDFSITELDYTVKIPIL